MYEQHQVHRSQRAPRTTLRFTAALSLLALFAAITIGACSSNDGTSCTDGVIRPDGKCEGKCDPSLCVKDNICVNNRCVLECTSHEDCLPDGSQDCLPASEDDTSRQTMTCQPNGKAFGVGLKCPFGNECQGFLSCPQNGVRCDLQQCDGKPETCTIDQDYCAGRAGCTVGKCPNGAACTVLQCKKEECTAPLSCLTKGEGDADAFCTKQDCNADSDCPGGYWCGVTRDPRTVCNSMVPQDVHDAICGSSADACVNAADLGKTDSTFLGQYCILRKTCLKRAECAPCESDLDCSQEPGMHCVAVPGEAMKKRCTRECKADKDCGAAYDCTPIDPNALDKGSTCVPRQGACTGTGKTCEPCVNDTDCGPLDGASYCASFSDGSRGCVNRADVVGAACTKDDDCPVVASGKHAYCDKQNMKCVRIPCSKIEFDPQIGEYCGRYGCY